MRMLQRLLRREEFDFKSVKMSKTIKERQDNSALFVLSAVALALITILTVWRLKQFKYRVINETGASIWNLFAGVFLGLAVKYLWLDGEEHLENMADVCSCHGLNSTPRVIMVNTSSQGHCYARIRKMGQRCSQLSSTHTVTMAIYFDLQRRCKATLDPEVLFNLFLPPIIFFGAYTLNQRRFIDNLGSVLTYAFLGTVISCFCIGACVYGFTRLMVLLGRAADGEFSLTDCLLFGAIMSATDPVSVLGLLSDLGVDTDLHALLFGESVLNDAVAIVLTQWVSHLACIGNIFDPPAFLRSVGFFLGVLIGSFLLGFIFTVITALISFSSPSHPSTPVSIITSASAAVNLLPYVLSFLSAEACGLSGIVAVLFCGLSQAKYTTLNLSHEGRTRTKQLFEVLNFLGEIFIFGYMGYIWFTFRHHAFRALFISGAFLSIFISRACNIYPLSFLINLGRRNKISRNIQHFMVFAGLRGAISFSLAVRNTSTEAQRTILTTTLLLISFTVWVLGAAAGPLLEHMDLRSVIKITKKYDRMSRLMGYFQLAALILSSAYQKYLTATLPFYNQPIQKTLESVGLQQSSNQ
uniref:Solute carrier family 9 member A9 n=1 Tax=Cyprinodon variegatus TaxID=28743 RepID=A0A3Q2FXK7_CYPVA